MPAVKQIPSSVAIVEQGRSTGKEDGRVAAEEQRLETLGRSTDKGGRPCPFSAVRGMSADARGSNAETVRSSAVKTVKY